MSRALSHCNCNISISKPCAMSLTTLPLDVLRSVLIQLEPSDLCALRETCNFFKDFADDEAIWKRKFHERFGG